MRECPTCRARYRGGGSCHRCDTDLSRILQIERSAVRHRKQALRALGDGRHDVARNHAEQACRLHRTPESIATLALSALHHGDFALALQLWREIRSP